MIDSGLLHFRYKNRNRLVTGIMLACLSSLVQVSSRRHRPFEPRELQARGGRIATIDSGRETFFLLQAHHSPSDTNGRCGVSLVLLADE
jgi:hypothetical protein